MLMSNDAGSEHFSVNTKISVTAGLYVRMSSLRLQSPKMFTTVQDDVCMIMKFLSNSPVTHVSANTHPMVPHAAVVTITCNHNFAVNRWNQISGESVSRVILSFCLTTSLIII